MPGRSDGPVPPPDPFESLPLPSDPPLTPATDAELHIPGYRLVRRLARGAMGVVYEAEQQHPKRRVALKILRGGAWADELARRFFDREIRALAQLEHPAIGRIYDAGVNADGQAWFAMEYVDGQQLEAYMAGRPPITPGNSVEVRRRLDIFVDVCRAVSWAHQRAVIHRDLKSSNILVVPGSNDAMRPTIKVLDFGLARIAESEGSLLLETGLMLGTLSTMSPEQTQADPAAVDVRSDVYALGVLLYRILVGAPPYRTEGLDVVEAIRTIRQTPAESPSRRQPLVSGDLETILLTALEKDPDRRYASVDALVGDITRYLERRPIQARRATLGYHLRLLVARHRLASASIAGLVVALVGFAVVMAVMFGRERRLRERVQVEAGKARRTTEFVQGMLASVNPSVSGVDVRVRDILDKTSGELAATLGDQPEVRAAVQETIGESYLALGLYAQAEANLKEALDLRREHLIADDPSIGTVELDMGRLLLESGGDLARAEEHARRGVAIRLRSSAGDELSIAAALNDLARILESRGKLEEAEAICRDALDRRIRTAGTGSPEVAESRNNLASILRSRGRPAEAEPLLRDAVRAWTAALGPDDPAVSTYQLNLARIVQDQLRFAEAESLSRAAFDLGRRSLPNADHPVTAAAGNALTLSLLYQGKYVEADTLARFTLGMWRRLARGAHPGTAAALTNLGFLCQATHRPDQAEAHYREAMSMAESGPGPGSLAVADAEFNLARIAQVGHRHREAVERLDHVLEIRRRVQGAAAPGIAGPLVARGLSLLELGEVDSAEVSIRGGAEHLAGPETWEAVLARHSLGVVLAVRGRCGEARPLLQSSEDFLLGPSGVPAWKSEPLERSARAHRACGDRERATRCHRAALALADYRFQ